MSLFSRRSFVKKLIGLTGAAVVAPAVLQNIAHAQEKRRGGGTGGGDLGLPLVHPGQGMAASMNYVNSPSDLKDAKLKVERAGVAWGKQTCANCMLYNKVGTKDGEEVGKCSIFANQLVKGQAWCASWSKKA